MSEVSDFRINTSGYFFHEDLDEPVLTDGAQVLHNISVFESLVQGNLLVQWLGVSGRDNSTTLPMTVHHFRTCSNKPVGKQ